MIYHSPRPFFIMTKDIEVYGCDRTYGNPSDIALISSCLLTVIVLDIYESYPTINWTNRCMINFTCLSVILFAGLTRVYNISSTLD